MLFEARHPILDRILRTAIDG